MIIGLVRHFKVMFTSHKKWYTSDEFREAMNVYDESPVKPNKVDLGNINWDVCFSSTMPRAVETAKTIYDGKIIFTDDLVEVPLMPFTTRKIKLPSVIWHIGGRIAWHKLKPSQKETRTGTRNRIDRVMEMIYESDFKNILIVSHGFFIFELTKRLNAEGFKGKIDTAPQNGKLYLFQRSQSY
ncbi:MAG: histidine phosphatase family protein [Melioribacteraceae bacterium]|nr:histidine phosphatase family protein [Melioribacteraceae bacterium]MCF8353654.1 histidine phosphatase family protein [Melioribacteraceae bacterium]MCF8393424.1 histidine phosphatase family protein [Melioribacteraceae bacterium]MCF8419281.1 histidine phosphatase family protein [Melioribacteraceae bacterium]